MELCRVCMGTQTDMNQIFDTKSQEIITKIQFCTGVLLTQQEGLPSKICTDCLNDLNIAHKFKTNCLNSEYIFQTVPGTVKDEPATDVSNDNVVKNNDVLNGDELSNENDLKDDELINDDDDCHDDVEYNLDYESSKEVKVEEDLLIERSVRRSKRVRLKNKQRNSVTSDDKKTMNSVKPIKKCGGYNMAGKNIRLKKLKFKRLWCEQCKMRFKTKKDSDDHKKQLHNEQEIWICEICGKTFEHRSSHYAHVRAHYPPRFACEQCDYKSTSKYDLAKHVRIHTGSKSYVCPICACAYRTSSNMRAHVRLTHERVRAHTCPLCARAFYDRTKLNRHIDSHNDVKRFTCDVCQACFSRRCYWKKHLQRQHDIVVPASRPGRRRIELRDPPAQA